MPKARKRWKKTQRGVTEETKKRLKEEIIKKLEENKKRYSVPQGFEIMAKDLGKDAYFVYVAAKELRKELGWRYKLDKSSIEGKLGSSLDKHAEKVINRINVEKLGQNLSEEECIKRIKEQLPKLGVPGWYDIGVARIILDAKEKELRKKGILEKK